MQLPQTRGMTSNGRETNSILLNRSSSENNCLINQQTTKKYPIIQYEFTRFITTACKLSLFIVCICLAAPVKLIVISMLELLTHYMTENSKNEDIVIATAADPRFQADEMIKCLACGKVNPPTRPKCMYCVAELPVTSSSAAHMRLEIRELEEWENGFNLIVLSSDPAKRGAAAESLSRLTGIECGTFERNLGRDDANPILRTGTSAEAVIAADRAREFGISTRVLPDTELAVDTPPVRLRTIEFSDEVIRITEFNFGTKITIPASELVLIVTGTLRSSRAETTSIRKKKTSTAVEEFRADDETPVIDIYSADNGHGWRIVPTGFDFSGLGASKSLLARTNMITVKKHLRTLASAAVLDDLYDTLRADLDIIWTIMPSRDSMGLQGTRLGKKSMLNVVRSSNAIQFTKYSRMRQRLL